MVEKQKTVRCGETLCAQASAQDQIGSVTAMINTQGKVAGTALYSPYGKLLQSKGVQANIAYAGLYHHQETGLYLATYRGYNPFTARWLNRDPIEENGGLNLYEYVGGDPINSIDLLGLWSASIKVHAGLGGSLTLGWSPGNGVFGSLQGGIGLDAGASFDPLDNGPFERELRKGPYADVCPNLKTGKRGISLGANINIGVSAYGYGVEYGAAGGRHFLDETSASYSERPSLKFGTNVLESSIGFSAGGSSNVEITLW